MFLWCSIENNNYDILFLNVKNICSGAGYHLNISKEETAPIPAISSVVNHHLKSAVLKINSDSQITYNVKDKESIHFPVLFAELEKFSSSLGIRGISITCTTMEDVFLKLVEVNLFILSVNS